MSATITRNDLPAIRSEMKRFFKETAPRIAAEVLADRIQARTDKGVDSSGQTFRKYSPKYAKYGRKKLGYRVRPVDLKRENKMRSSLRYYDRLTVNEGTGHALAVGPGKQNLKAIGNQSTREWIGTNPGDAEAVGREIVENLKSLSIHGS